jgi:O-antigen ligase
MMRDPVTLLLVGIAALLVGGLAFLWLLRQYQTPLGPERVVALLLGLLVVESSLYENPTSVPTGLFHPQAGPLSFRLFDLLIPLAIVAYMVARPPGRRPFGIQVPLWGAFVTWLAVTAVVGVYEGNSVGLVAFHAKAIIYLSTFALVAAVPPRRWLESVALRRVIVGSSVLAGCMLLLSESGVSIDLGIPGLRLVGFGALGSDAATLFAVLGVGVLAVALCSEQARLRQLALAVPLLAAPLASGQRAAMLGLAVGVGAALVLIPFAARNVRLKVSEVVLIGMAVVGIVMVLVLVDAVSGQRTSLPLASQIQDSFQSRGKQLSEQDRVNQWAQARRLIGERPVLGWGLGKEYEYYSPGFYEFMRTDITHNIVTDLLLRTGAVGLLLFLAAYLATLWDAALSWVRELDARVAAIGLAAFCALSGLFVKGLVESLFEKYRLAIVIGALIGVSMSAAAARVSADAPVPAAAWTPRARRNRGALAR